MKTILLLYLPVLHAGYMKLFEELHDTVSALAILGEPFLDEFKTFHKEIRALKPETAKMILEKLRLFAMVTILTKETISLLNDAKIIAVQDELIRRFAQTYLPNHASIRWKNVFLRWDEKTVKTITPPEATTVSTDPFDQEMINRAKQQAQLSSDWWRQVGAVLVKDTKHLLETYNTHVPSEHMPYLDGDPRDVIEAGTQVDLYTSLHGEQRIIVEAARHGVSLEGAHLYVTAFPCPVCAKLIAYSGITKLFFAEGHATLDGERILKQKGVQYIWVQKRGVS